VASAVHMRGFREERMSSGALVRRLGAGASRATN